MSGMVADELTLKIDSNVTGALAGLSTVESASKGTATRVAMGAGKLVAGAGVAAAVAGVAVGGIAAKMATSFETGMAQIEALVGVPKDEMEELSAAALRMGGQFGVSADEAAGGLFFLKSAGLETNEAITALEQSAMASAIGLGTMEELANTATTAMSNFGIDSGEAYDMIGTAAKLAKADPAELGRIMNQNSATASLLGVEYGELGGLSALLTRKFGDAAMSGTALGAVMNKVVKPSQQAQKELEKIGWTAQDLKDAVKEKGLSGALTDLNTAFADSGIATDEWLGKVMEDSRGIKGAAAIIGTGADEFDEIFTGMAESSGMVSEGWAVMSDTAAVKMGMAMESVKSALIPVGLVILDIVVPAIVTLGEWVTKGIEWFQNLVGGSEDLEEGVTGALQGVKDFVAGIVEWWDEHWNDISDLIAAFQETFEGILNDIVAFAEPLLQDMAVFFEETFGGIVDWFNENWPYIKETIEIVLMRVQQIWDIVWPYLQLVIEHVWENIKIVITTVIGVIQGILETVMGIIRGDWEQAWNGIKKIFGSVWDGIRGLLVEKWELLKAFVLESVEKLKAPWETAWNKIKDAVGTAFGGIVSAVKVPFNAVLSALESGINSALRLLQGAIDAADVLAGPFINFPDNAFTPVSVPRLSDGGFINRGGTVKVGEAGEELLNLPPGASVTPLDGGGTPMSGGLYIENFNSGADPHKLAEELGWEFMKRGL